MSASGYGSVQNAIARSEYAAVDGIDHDVGADGAGAGGADADGDAGAMVAAKSKRGRAPKRRVTFSEHIDVEPDTDDSLRLRRRNAEQGASVRIACRSGARSMDSTTRAARTARPCSTDRDGPSS